MPIHAVSTSWRTEKMRDAGQLSKAMKETGLNSLELEFRLWPETVEDLKKKFTQWGLEILTLHAPCPGPFFSGKKGTEYLLSDDHEEKRMKGVEQIRQTLIHAADFNARAVILHCGRIPMEEPIYQMMEHYDKNEMNSAEAKKFLRQAENIRREHGKKHLPPLLRSLDTILSEAEKLDVNVGLENRYYFAEMPDREEFQIIFDSFKTSRLGYWHDTGHAHVREILFGLSQKEILDAFSDRLMGVHFHDAKGYTDHSEPGSGEINFDLVKRYLKEDTIRVMELNSRVDLEGAKRGIRFLEDKGIF